MYEVHNGDFAAAIKKLDDEALLRMKKETIASSIEHEKHSKASDSKLVLKEQAKIVACTRQFKYGNFSGIVLVMIVIMILTSSLNLISIENWIMFPILIAIVFSLFFHKKIKK